MGLIPTHPSPLFGASLVSARYASEKVFLRLLWEVFERVCVVILLIWVCYGSVVVDWGSRRHGSRFGSFRAQPRSPTAFALLVGHFGQTLVGQRQSRRFRPLRAMVFHYFIRCWGTGPVWSLGVPFGGARREGCGCKKHRDVGSMAGFELPRRIRTWPVSSFQTISV